MKVVGVIRLLRYDYDLISWILSDTFFNIKHFLAK